MAEHDAHAAHDDSAPHGEHEECHELLGGLSDYVDGIADAALCAEIELHLAGCENCRVVVDTLSRTVSLYQALPEADVPEDVSERLLRVLKLDAGP